MQNTAGFSMQEQAPNSHYAGNPAHLQHNGNGSHNPHSNPAGPSPFLAGQAGGIPVHPSPGGKITAAGQPSGFMSTNIPPPHTVAAHPSHQDQQPDQHMNGNGTSDDNHVKEEADAALTASGISPEDIQTVQNLVERCLQLYMARDEVVNVLKNQATIDPGFTQLVWSKLEEQNPEFFKCYYTRLKLKAQIVMFNHLLEQQVAVVQRMQHGWSGGAGAGPTSATTGGIPLFQGSGANGNGAGNGTDGGKDRLVPGSTGDLMGALPSGLDGHGAGALFSPLPQIGSEHDLANLGNLPTPAELNFLPGSSPLNLVPHGSAPATLPRSFSLSDLGGLDNDPGTVAKSHPLGDGHDNDEPVPLLQTAAESHPMI